MGTFLNSLDISAVAVLDSDGLTIYHNVFAVLPLPMELFTGIAVRQFTLREKQPGEFDMWREIGSHSEDG